MNNKWIGAVLSTDKDLKEERSAVITLLKEYGVKVSAFENPDFPLNTAVHSHENCLIALQRVDFAIFIINKNSGGECYNDIISITRAEYNYIVSNQKPAIVLVEKNTWEESEKFYNAYKASGKVRDEFASDYETSYVDSVEVLKWIDDIQHQYATTQYSNWISKYYGIDNLKEIVIGKLSGLSRQYLQKVSEEQGKLLRKRRTSTPVASNLGDIFDKEYYIEPQYQYIDGTPTDGPLANQIVKSLIEGNSILIKGEAGYGKTTVLAKAFLHNLELAVSEKSYTIPFLLQLRDKTASYDFDLREYLDECFSTIQKEKYPFLDITGLSFIFYLDGFDELSEDISTEELERIAQTTIFQAPFLLTSRSQYANRYLNNYYMCERFSSVIKISKWDPTTSETYINNFCEKAKKGDDFTENVRKLLCDNAELQDTLNSPLLISMFLSIIENEGIKYSKAVKTRVSLFRISLQKMAEREHNKYPLISAGDILDFWAYFSWFVYRNRLIKSTEVNIDQIFNFLNSIRFKLDRTTERNLVEAIFEIKGLGICNAFHEQFFEFLVAYALCDACITKNEPYPEFLKYVIRPEINRYFRGIWRETSDDKKTVIFNNLYNQYYENLAVEDNDIIATRVHAIYHLSRLEHAKRKEMLRRAYILETHISVKISLYFGLIKLGDLEKEEEFYQLLENDAEYNSANRGYHLVYYDDMVPDNPMFPYMDNQVSAWVGTKNAFIHHFNSEKDSHYFLRRIDLATMRHLVISRKLKGEQEFNVNLEVFRHYIENTCQQLAKKYPEYQRKIECEYALLENELQAKHDMSIELLKKKGLSDHLSE